jgi:hypothetical protein
MLRDIAARDGVTLSAVIEEWLERVWRSEIWSVKVGATPPLCRGNRPSLALDAFDAQCSWFRFRRA